MANWVCDVWAGVWFCGSTTLLHRLWLQTNLFWADSGSKWRNLLKMATAILRCIRFTFLVEWSGDASSIFFTVYGLYLGNRVGRYFFFLSENSCASHWISQPCLVIACPWPVSALAPSSPQCSFILGWVDKRSVRHAIQTSSGFIPFLARLPFIVKVIQVHKHYIEHFEH